MSCSTRVTRAFALLIVAAFAVSSVPAMLGEGPVEDAMAQTEIYVKCGWGSEILVWNPMDWEMFEDYVAGFLIYSAMFQYDEDYDMLVPDLCIDYNTTVHDSGTPSDPDDDWMSVTFNVTHNAYFRNKAMLDAEEDPIRLTAHDVAYTYNLIITEDAGTWPYYLDGISDIRVIDQGVLGDESDDFQFVMDAEYVKATLVEDLGGLPIICKAQWEEDYKTNPCTKSMKPEELMGTGPMVYDSMLKGSWWQFVKAPFYHAELDYGQERDIDIDGVIFSLHGNSMQLATALNAGDIDAAVLTGDPNTYIDFLGEGDLPVDIVKHAVPELGICDIAINAIPFVNRTATYGNGFELLVDPQVRYAIQMCLNKSYINKIIMKNLTVQADSVLTPGYWHLDIQNEVPFDPEGARKMLEDSGNYSDIDGDDILECIVTDTSDWKSEYYGVSLDRIRCQAPDTDQTWYDIAKAWAGWALDAGIGLAPEQKAEGVMVSQAWYQADYDIWVWHWGWGPEPLSTMAVWLTETMTVGGDNCEMPMGPDTGDYPGQIYDETLRLAQRTLDLAERKVLVDQLQQWVHDSWCECPPYYDVGLYGYTEARFTGWGNWTEHSGLSFMMGLPWLWQNLEPADNMPPQISSSVTDPYEAVKDEVSVFEISIFDDDGDHIWANWTFGDGSPMVSNHTDEDTSDEPITFRQEHVYTALASSLTLTVNITDGIPGHTVVSRTTVKVVDVYDEGPSITGIYSSPASPVYVNTPVTFTATASDPEATELKFTWDWDDGTYTSSTVDVATAGEEVEDQQVHSWDSDGNYDIRVHVWDGYDLESNLNHNVTTTNPRTYEILVNAEPDDPDIAPITTLPNVWTECSASTSDFDPDTLRITWDWGDGTYNVTEHDTSGSQGERVVSSVMHLWTSEGTHSVTVWVDDLSDMTGHNVSTTIDATVEPAGTEVPPASIQLDYEPDPVIVDNSVAMTVWASDANGDLLTFTVEFGDDTEETKVSDAAGTNPQIVTFDHVYDTTGDKTVVVHVDDGTFNESREFVISVEEVPVNSPPELNLMATYTAKYNQTFTVKPVDLYDEDGDELSVWYDWGDGAPMTEGDPADLFRANHTYNETGAFKLTVYADDNTGLDGHNVSENATVTVSEGNLKPTIVTKSKSPDQTVYGTDEKILFNVTVRDTEGDEITVRIDFGDGSAVESRILTPTAPGQNMSTSFNHTFGSEGEFTVRVWAEDEYDHSTAWASGTWTIEVEDEGGGGLSLVLIAGIGLLAIIALIVAVMLLKKRGGKAEGEETGGMEGMAPPEEPPLEEPPSSS
jgi:hypothetical protein